MHESKELISVIVPVYNRESVLEKCINSVSPEGSEKARRLRAGDTLP